MSNEPTTERRSATATPRTSKTQSTAGSSGSWVNQIPRRIDLTVTAERTFDQAIDALGADRSQCRALKTPDRILKRQLTTEMDDGSRRTFSAYRVQHSNVLGPYKGGFRFDPGLETSTLAELASLMTWKASLAGLPFGGGKGGIRVDAEELSRRELRRLTDAYVQAFREAIGPDKDIMAPDLNTDEEVMGWLVDAWAGAGPRDAAVVTGKPVEIGGIRLRSCSTALGVLVMTQRSLAEEGRDLSDSTIAIQGFGNVGQRAAQLFAAAGARIMAVSDVSGGVQDPGGLDIARLRSTCVAPAESRGSTRRRSPTTYCSACLSIASFPPPSEVSSPRAMPTASVPA